MRFLLALVIGIGLLSGFPALATTLRLPEEMELLIVDGKPLGSTLLRGADSLELAQGRHQLVFTVASVGSEPPGSPHAYTSPYIVAQFHTHNARQLIFQLPVLTLPAERDRFSHQPLIRLTDEHGAAVDATFNRLTTDSSALTDALRRYNLDQGLARPSPPPAGDGSGGHTGISGSAPVSPTGGVGAGQIEQMLQFWFLQADDTTRVRFLQWAQGQHKAPTSSHRP